MSRKTLKKSDVSHWRAICFLTISAMLITTDFLKCALSETLWRLHLSGQRLIKTARGKLSAPATILESKTHHCFLAHVVAVRSLGLVLQIQKLKKREINTTAEAVGLWCAIPVRRIGYRFHRLDSRCLEESVTGATMILTVLQQD